MQNPSTRPGRSPRARPTGTPQSEREQNRFRSGTSGFSSTIVCGSGRGTCGTRTSPAPSRERPDPPAVEPELRTDTERPVELPEGELPEGERDNRPETERRDCEEREDCEDREDWGEAPHADTTGARPHMSQYSSPPPTSSYEPEQPGR